MDAPPLPPDLHLPAATILAGALGGLARWLSMRESWQQGIVSVVIGSIASVYLGPLTMSLMDPLLQGLTPDVAARAGFAGFVTGLGGIGLMRAVIDLVKLRGPPPPPTPPKP